jgi:hypothetical protein
MLVYFKKKIYITSGGLIKFTRVDSIFFLQHCFEKKNYFLILSFDIRLLHFNLYKFF